MTRPMNETTGAAGEGVDGRQDKWGLETLSSHRYVFIIIIIIIIYYYNVY